MFYLSLIPVLTKWVGSHPRSNLPAAAYGIVALMAGVAYSVLVWAIVRANGGSESTVARALGSNLKGRVSIGLYAFGVATAWITPWVAYGAYIAVSVMWFIPDPRLEHRPVDPESA